MMVLRQNKIFQEVSRQNRLSLLPKNFCMERKLTPFTDSHSVLGNSREAAEEVPDIITHSQTSICNPSCAHRKRMGDWVHGHKVGYIPLLQTTFI